MKKIKLNNKLQLNKETIARLNDEELRNVNGGEALTSISWCVSKRTYKCEPNPTTLTQGPNQCSLPGTTCLTKSDLQCGCSD